MDKIIQHVELLERRLTILERVVSRLANSDVDARDRQLISERKVAVDDPGIVYFGSHSVEKNSANEKFIWLGGTGDIQLVLPPSGFPRTVYDLELAPHPAVHFNDMTLRVNDKVCAHKFERGKFGWPRLSFEIDGAGTTPVNIVIAGVKSICPAELEESTDPRRLAFMFFGYDIRNCDTGVGLEVSG